MNEARKKAYRELLFLGMLHIRHLCAWSEEEGSDPETRAMQHQGRRLAGAIAYWMHNLAGCSIDDFAGFNEDEFWHQCWVKEIVPDLDIAVFRKHFEEALAKYQQQETEN